MTGTYVATTSHPAVREERLWITDSEVRAIFLVTRCFYTFSDGFSKKTADGIYVREQRSKEGTLGRVFLNPINGEKWLWVISKKTRMPFALAKVG